MIALIIKNLLYPIDVIVSDINLSLNYGLAIDNKKKQRNKN